MAQIDQNKSVTWVIPGGESDPELAEDIAELNSHPILIEKYGQLLLDLSGAIGESVREHGLEALTFFTKAFKIQVMSGWKVMKQNAKRK